MEEAIKNERQAIMDEHGMIAVLKERHNELIEIDVNPK